MNGIPIIKIELEGMKQSIQAALTARGEEFDTMIHAAVDKIFTIETIQAKIDMQVAKALDNAIDSLSESHHVREIVKDIVVNSLVQKRDKLEKEST